MMNRILTEVGGGKEQKLTFKDYIIIQGTLEFRGCIY